MCAILSTVLDILRHVLVILLCVFTEICARVLRLVPKLQLGHALVPRRSASPTRNHRRRSVLWSGRGSRASKTRAFPSWSLGTRGALWSAAGSDSATPLSEGAAGGRSASFGGHTVRAKAASALRSAAALQRASGRRGREMGSTAFSTAPEVAPPCRVHSKERIEMGGMDGQE